MFSFYVKQYVWFNGLLYKLVRLAAPSLESRGSKRWEDWSAVLSFEI